jgi:peptidoglycan/LPS O-acetylase OafA/YrhL
MSEASSRVSASSDRQFRTDINGLRAWAVIAVVLYHFGVPGFSGGFVGVDIFFVISGFLMTGICIRGLEGARFSFIDFYASRARRIVPALAALCLILMVLGWFYLLPPDYKMLSTHSAYSLSFLSNIEYFMEAGYFDAASHEKWLLHTWSLSVEWQFYLLLPVMLWVTWWLKPGRATQLWVMTATFAASLITSVVVTKVNPSAAFFLLHTRAWEMLAGGLVMLLAHPGLFSPALRPWIERAGLLLIILSIALFDSATAWPGAWALLPVVATMMVIASNAQSPWTGNRLAQWLGNRSYSIYLWHWPLYVVLVYTDMHRQPVAVAASLLATLVVSHMSYLLIESRGQQLRSMSNWRALSALAGLVAVIVIPAVVIWQRAGVDGRFDARIEYAAAQGRSIHPLREKCHSGKAPESPSCRFGVESPKITAMLIGDSHAAALLPGVSTAASSTDSGVVLWTYNACPYLPGNRFRPEYLKKLPPNYDCLKFNAWVQSQVAKAPPGSPVIIAARYAAAAYGLNEELHDKPVAPPMFFSEAYASTTPAYLREFSSHIVSAACDLVKSGHPVYLVRPVPEMAVHVPKTASRRMSFGLSGEVSIPAAAYEARNRWVWQAQDMAVKQCGVKIIDISTRLCRLGRCYGTLDEVPMYQDDDHLSVQGSTMLAPLFEQVFKQ